jgi:hypothetical protein
MSETNMIEWLEYVSTVTSEYADYNSEAGICSCGLLTSDCPDSYTHMSQGY